MVQAERIIDEHGREITDDGEILDSFQILDIYDEEGEEKPPRPAWIATCSAGFKNAKGYPESSKDGTIHVSGDLERCQGLVAALEKTGGKRLTVAFLSDNLADFIFQRFTRRSATSLEVYGDQYGLSEIKLIGYEPELYANGKPKLDPETKQPLQRPIYEHITHAPRSAEYKALRKTCKVEVSVLFALAEWDGQRTAVTFPDGLGAYRLRFTSRNSLQAIVGKLEEIKTRITRGRIAGVPFDLSLTYRDVPSPTGQTRNVPVWTLEFRPPEAIRLTSGNLAKLLGGALSEGQKLQVLLPAPRYDITDAMAEESDVDLEHEDLTKFQMPSMSEALDVLQNGDPPCNVANYRNAWHSGVKEHPTLSTDGGRHDFVGRFTAWLYTDQPDRQTTSLEAFLAHARESEASKLMAMLVKFIVSERRATGSLQSPQATESRESPQSTESTEATESPEEPHAIASQPSADAPEPGPFEINGALDPSADAEDLRADQRAAASTTTDAAKSKARRQNETVYAALMESAGRLELELDLAPFETNAQTSDAELDALLNKLAAAVRIAGSSAVPAGRR